MKISLIVLGAGVIGLVIGHLATKFFPKRRESHKELSMSAENKDALVEKLAEELNKEASRAVRLNAILSSVTTSDTLHKELASKLNNTEECYVFNACMDAVLFELIMTLMRMHDNRSPQRKRVCFEELFYYLKDRSVVANFEQKANDGILSRGYIVDPDTPEMRKMIEEKRAEDAKNARTNVIPMLDAARTNFERIKGSHWKSRLQRSVRHEMYAHNALEPKAQQIAKYQDIEPLLRDTLLLLDKLNKAILDINENFGTEENIWNRRTKSLWTRLN